MKINIKPYLTVRFKTYLNWWTSFGNTYNNRRSFIRVAILEFIALNVLPLLVFWLWLIAAAILFYIIYFRLMFAVVFDFPLPLMSYSSNIGPIVFQDTPKMWWYGDILPASWERLFFVPTSGKCSHLWFQQLSVISFIMTAMHGGHFVSWLLTRNI